MQIAIADNHALVAAAVFIPVQVGIRRRHCYRRRRIGEDRIVFVAAEIDGKRRWRMAVRELLFASAFPVQVIVGIASAAAPAGIAAAAAAWA